MADPREQDLFDGDENNGIHRLDQSNGEDYDSSTFVHRTSLSGVGSNSGVNGESRNEMGLTDPLAEILVDEGDSDLLLRQRHGEDKLLQWLQALDMQFMGACRADERLKPLLKMNVSCGVAEDPLLTQLSQHFDPAEVGMLARCFCVPLVSIRVGKINKEGSRLCPTADRGNLTLTLLPNSDLRLSFIGDDGDVERIFTLLSKSQSSAVAVDEIPEDSSGRSFLIKALDGRTSYFWCSEKSKLLGIELLSKLKNLLKRKPSIAELSGISKSRLDCFATQLRAFLIGSTVGNNHETGASTLSANSTTICNEVFGNIHLLSTSKFSRCRQTVGQAVKGSALYQGSLSPRSSSFKEGPPRNLYPLRVAAGEKMKRRGDSQQSAVDNLTNSSTNTLDASPICSANDKPPAEVNKNSTFSPLGFLGPVGKLAVPSSLGSVVQAPSLVSSPLFSPHYCWCPPGVSTFPSPAAFPQSPVSSIGSPPFPSQGSLFPNTMPASLLTPAQPLNLSTSMDFPPFLPDPLIRMSLPTSQQIPTFTPLICDPIVHVPVIDVCSSGQGYLVSAGAGMSTTIPPLHPNLVKPMISESDSVVEGARETLRLLISGSSQGNEQVMDALPAVLNNPDEKANSILVAGSRGLYTGTRDINVIANSIAAMGLVSLSAESPGDTDSKACGTCGISEQAKRPIDTNDTAPKDEDAKGQ